GSREQHKTPTPITIANRIAPARMPAPPDAPSRPMIAPPTMKNAAKAARFCIEYPLVERDGPYSAHGAVAMPRFTNPADQVGYQAMRAACKAAGLSRQQFDAAVAWYEKQSAGMSPEQLMQSFYEYAGHHGWDTNATTAAIAAYEGVNIAGGPEVYLE